MAIVGTSVVSADIAAPGQLIDPDNDELGNDDLGNDDLGNDELGQ
jgi:hypothetical protein